MFQTLFQRLKNRQPQALLCPAQPWNVELSPQIAQANDEELFGMAATNDLQSEMYLACRSGLLLLNDDLPASHALSQHIETPTGAFWHAIMHRREGDFSNSRFWWQRVGKHPAFDDVYTAAMSTLIGPTDPAEQEFAEQLERAGTWIPQEFVAACESAASAEGEGDWLRRVQHAEMTALLQWCHAHAA